MPLKLNTAREAYKAFPEKGTAPNTEQMPRLIAEGRIPMNAAQLMQRRIDLRNAEADVKTAWMDNYFDTSDLKGQKGNEIKLVLTTYADGSITPLGKKYLGLINPDEELINGAVNLGVDGRYEGLQGEGVMVTKKSKLAAVVDSWLTEQQAKDSLFWRILNRHPDEVPKELAIPGLHEEVIPYIFSECKQRFDYDKAMGVFPGSCNGDAPELRAVCVSGLDNRSVAYGGVDLGNGSGRLVGLAPEALVAKNAGASAVQKYTMADVQTANEQLEALAKFVRPESVDRVRSLLEKL